MTRQDEDPTVGAVGTTVAVALALALASRLVGTLPESPRGAAEAWEPSPDPSHPGRVVLAGLAATGFVVLGALILRDDGPAWIGWSAIVFGATAACFAPLRLIRPSRG